MEPPHHCAAARPAADSGYQSATDRALRPVSENAGPSMPQLTIRCGTMLNQAESQPPPPKRSSPPSWWSSARPRISIPRGVHGSTLARCRRRRRSGRAAGTAPGLRRRGIPAAPDGKRRHAVHAGGGPRRQGRRGHGRRHGWPGRRWVRRRGVRVRAVPDRVRGLDRRPVHRLARARPRPARHRSAPLAPRLADCCQIAVSITMAYMLITML